MSNRTRRILEEFEAVRENLLVVSDDIWLSIDHNDSETLEEGASSRGPLTRGRLDSAVFRRTGGPRNEPEKEQA